MALALLIDVRCYYMAQVESTDWLRAPVFEPRLIKEVACMEGRIISCLGQDRHDTQLMTVYLDKRTMYICHCPQTIN